MWRWIKSTAQLDLILRSLRRGLMKSIRARHSREISKQSSLTHSYISHELSAVAYGMELFAVIAFHQKTFLAKKPFHFRSICDDLGWELSVAFCDYFYPILFVICANPSLVKTSTASIKGQWGTSTNQNKVKKALKEAAKAAEESQNIKYKETFKLLKIIFPQLLKWFSLIFGIVDPLLSRTYVVDFRLK